MFFRLKSSTITGVEASIIEIEVDLKRGLPAYSIVGLPDPAIKEAKERVSAAIRNSGYDFPLGALTVNLAPAELKKTGSVFDLAMALGILIVSGTLESDCDFSNYLFVGELSLDGYVRPVRGILAILQKAHACGIGHIVLPEANMREASLYPRGRLHPVCFLHDAVEVIAHPQETNTADSRQRYKQLQDNKGGCDRFPCDYSDVRGQAYAVRAVLLAAAGNHNILLIGSPGAGKTMIASRIPTILPEMTEEESIETTKIYSIAGLLDAGKGLIRNRPFRAPHHTASDVAIIGGGRNPIPGEITLSHNGVLFLDEFTEFRSNIIQSLRQPLESGFVVVARADSRVRFPSRFMLAAAMNPCPCGYLFDPERTCRCTPRAINHYFMKISGPVLDRIDIQVEVKPLRPREILEGKPVETSVRMRKQVKRARDIQIRRQGVLNADLPVRKTEKLCGSDSDTANLLYKAVDRFKLSARSYYKILRVARTVADLDERERIGKEDVLEALSYREVESIIYAEERKDGVGPPG